MSQPTIYLDVLILTNVFVTYFLLLSTQKFLHMKSKKGRIVMAAVVGGLYSMMILVQGVSPVILTALKLAVAVLLVGISFGVKSIKLLAKNTIVFFVINFVYAGFMFALWYFVTPPGMIYQNGVAYFNISAVVLAVSTIAAYLVIQLVSYLMAKNVQHNQIRQIEISCDGRAVLLSAFVDTGNKLHDIITGLPIVICDVTAIKELIPQEIHPQLQTLSLDTIQNTLWKKRLRIIPVQAVTGQSTVIAFKPDAFFVTEEQGKEQKQALIGISREPLSQGEFQALMGSDLCRTL